MLGTTAGQHRTRVALGGMADLERAAVDIDYALEAIKRVDPARERVAERHMMYDMADIDPAGVWTLLHVLSIVASSYQSVRAAMPQSVGVSGGATLHTLGVIMGWRILHSCAEWSLSGVAHHEVYVPAARQLMLPHGGHFGLRTPEHHEVLRAG